MHKTHTVRRKERTHTEKERKKRTTMERQMRGEAEEDKDPDPNILNEQLTGTKGQRFQDPAQISITHIHQRQTGT